MREYRGFARQGGGRFVAAEVDDDVAELARPAPRPAERPAPEHDPGPHPDAARDVEEVVAAGPLLGQGGEVGTDQSMVQGEDVYRRAEELLAEIRRRAAEQERPKLELDYLKRLLDRF